jgi:hypothetical protein
MNFAEKDIKNAVGKTITSLSVANDGLIIGFTDQDLTLSDGLPSCCEHRYMVCDDKLENFVGGTFLGATIEDAPDVESAGGYHEVQFLHVKTSKGSFTVSNHNEHNGYYGGFSLHAAVRKK